jgi:hypothetical protein
MSSLLDLLPDLSMPAENQPVTNQLILDVPAENQPIMNVLLEDLPNVNPLLNVFPSINSVPPATFYTMQGLAKYLNQNPEYKPYFTGYTTVSPYLLPMTSTLADMGYDPRKVPIAPMVKNLSQYQFLEYSQQLRLFQTVYSFNSTAYGNYVMNNIPPVYFRFQTYKEYTNFKSAVSVVNKMYPFDAMAYGTDPETGITLGWVVPFPL